MANSPANLLNEIYKTCQMSIAAIDKLDNLSPNKDLNNELDTQKNRYSSFSDSSKTLLDILGETPKEPSLLSKTAADTGIVAKTLFQKDPSHIADLMIKGTTMGVVDLTKALDGFGNQDQAVGELAGDVLDYQEQCIDRLKSYL